MTLATLEADIAMSPKSDEFRRKAKEAEALAEAARDQNAKQTYLEVAKQRHKLAEEAERKDS